MIVVSKTVVSLHFAHEVYSVDKKIRENQRGLFQLILGKLKSPIKTRAVDFEASFSSSKYKPSVSSPQAGGVLGYKCKVQPKYTYLPTSTSPSDELLAVGHF